MPAGISTPGRIRRASRGASWKPTVVVTMPGTSARPASSGVIPPTSWKYCATNTITPPDSIENAIMLPSVTREGPTREQPHVHQRVRQPTLPPYEHPAERPHRTTRPPMAVVLRPCEASCFSPWIAGRIAASDSSTLGTSIRPAFSSRYSGSRNGPTASSTTIAGTPIRNAEPHQK